MLHEQLQKIQEMASGQPYPVELKSMKLGELKEGEINPVIDSIWRFERVSEAQMHMHNRKNKGKILLDFS